MNHRERALIALNHQEPDRVPIDLGATRNSGILVEPYQALVKCLGLESEMFHKDDFGQSKIAGIATVSEAVLERLDVDFRGIFLGMPDKSLECMLPNGSHKDELGVVRERPASSYYFDVVYSPLDRDDITLERITNWNWPDPTDCGYIRGLREEALELRLKTDYAIVLHLQDIIVHPSQYMRGFKRWYMDFILEPSIMHELLDKLFEIRTVLSVRALKEVGDLIDVVSSSDDIADQRGPLVSPSTYCKFIKPRHREYFDALRQHTSAKILYHTCGDITSLIPDIIDIGVDFLNPVQVSAENMDTEYLKNEYGKDIGFWGSIDNVHVLPYGTPEEVRDEVKKRIRDLGPGGGFVLAAVHNIQPDVPPENIIAMFDEARKIGTYPISC